MLKNILLDTLEILACVVFVTGIACIALIGY